jgi:hypothetical protein
MQDNIRELEQVTEGL